jgi:hypothetical protein
MLISSPNLFQVLSSDPFHRGPPTKILNFEVGFMICDAMLIYS